MNNILSRLLALINGGGALQVLKDIVGAVLDGKPEAAQTATLVYLNKRVNAQEGRTAAKTLARAMLKQGENAMGPTDLLTLEQRIAVGQALFANGALQMAHASDLYLALGEAQAGLERARGTAGEDVARTAREVAEAAFIAAAVNIGRVTAGAAPLDHA